MIRQLRGIVVGHEEDALIVEAGGIGYLVRVTFPTEQALHEAPILLHTHLAIRENAHDLYGFLDRDTLEIFELLIELPKIGPKSAQQILRQADVGLLKQAVWQGDAGYLSKMSGIGKKSAEKIVVGLKDKLDDLSGVSVKGALQEETASLMYARDTIDALVTLGYSEEDARKVVRELTETNPEVTTSPEALRAALKILSN